MLLPTAGEVINAASATRGHFQKTDKAREAEGPYFLRGVTNPFGMPDVNLR